MTTGKHSDLQTLQNSDGTFELVVANDAGDEWSEPEFSPADSAPKVAWYKRIPWKTVVVGAAVLGVVGAVASMVVKELRSGVTLSDEPLPVVSGFRPYTGGASAGLGSGKRSPASRTPVVEDEEWADEEEPREIVVEKGEPAVVEEVEEPVNLEQANDEALEQEAQAGHEIEPSGLPNIPRDPAGIQKNLNRQLKSVTGQPLNIPMNRPDFGAVFGGSTAPVGEAPAEAGEIPAEEGVQGGVGEIPGEPVEEPLEEIEQENN